MAEHADLIASLADSFCTRTLNRFAEESRLDGESLKDAVQRYEIDYAWQVLGSDRLHDETLALLEAKLKQPATRAQKSCVAEVLNAAAMGQSSDLLMSFDNDVSERLAALIFALHESKTLSDAEAVS